jgi:hypothetical protein
LISGFWMKCNKQKLRFNIIRAGTQEKIRNTKKKEKIIEKSMKILNAMQTDRITLKLRIRCVFGEHLLCHQSLHVKS